MMEEKLDINEFHDQFIEQMKMWFKNYWIKSYEMTDVDPDGEIISVNICLKQRKKDEVSVL